MGAGANFVGARPTRSREKGPNMINEFATISVKSHITPENSNAIDRVNEKYGVDYDAMVEHIRNHITNDLLNVGREWYPNAYAFARDLAETHNISTPRAAAVISALSPRMGWDRNKRIAESVIQSWTEGRTAEQIKGALGANIRIAVAILDGHDPETTLTGIKRRSFYNNIITAGTSDDVTVDTWMQRAAMAVSPDAGMDLDESVAYLKARNNSGYVAIAEAVREVANQLGTHPSIIQAAYWLAQTGSVHGSHFKGVGKSDAPYNY